MLDEKPQPITQNLPVTAVIDYLTKNWKRGFTPLSVRNVEEQLAPPHIRDHLKNTEGFTDDQIKLLLRFELMRQEIVRPSPYPHLMMVYYAIKTNLKGTQARSDDFVKEETKKIERCYPKGIPVSPLDMDIYREKKISLQDMVEILENEPISVALKEFTKTPFERSMLPPRASLLKDRLQREVTNALPLIRETDITTMTPEVQASPFFDFAKHAISLAHVVGFALLPENISLTKEGDGLTISCTQSAAEELERNLVSLKNTPRLGSRMLSLTTDIELRGKQKGQRLQPALIHISGTALEDHRLLLEMRKAIENKTREKSGQSL